MGVTQVISTRFPLMASNSVCVAILCDDHQAINAFPSQPLPSSLGRNLQAAATMAIQDIFESTSIKMKLCRHRRN